MDTKKTLYIAVACYNEEPVLRETARRLAAKLQSLTADFGLSEGSRILFVNDGSRDNTWALIKELSSQYPAVCGISLSHNRGQMNALMAGLMYSRERADYVITLDADLQDDVDAMDGFIREAEKGAEIVYGVRSSRDTDTVMKRATAEGYYRLMQKLGVELVFNHAEYRLMTKRALDCLAEFDEVNLFLRGIVPSLGFRTAVVTYERAPRFAGESKYPLRKMLAFAAEGVTSFSVKPLRLILSLGLLTCAGAVIALVTLLICLWCGAGVTLPAFGYAGLWLLGGMQLTGMGVLGEYLGKVYSETKRRPRYFIEESVGGEAPAGTPA